MSSSSSTSNQNRGPSTSSIDSTIDTTTSEQIEQSAQAMFDKILKYVSTSVGGTMGELQLLEQLNSATTQKHNDMKQAAIDCHERLDAVNSKYKNLQLILEQIDNLEESSRNIEAVAHTLDAYTKNLEIQIKQMTM